MTRTVEISDGLAREIERQRESRGLPTFSAAAEAVIMLGLQAAEDEADDFGLDTETLQALVNEALASGPPRPWSMDEVRAEIRRRYPKGQPE